MAAYRADIEIGVKGLRQVELLQRKVKELSDAVTDLAFKRFAINDTLLKRSQFFVEQERKLLAARTEYNKELQTSVRLAVEFDQRVRRSLAFAAEARQTRARALPSSDPVGLLPAQATGTPFRRAERRAARIDSAYARLAAAAEGTTAEFVRIAAEGRTFRALPAAGQATVNYFQIAETAARAIDKQNAATARYEAALNKLAEAAKGTYSTFVRFNAGMSQVAGLLTPARIAGLLPAGIGGQRALPPGRVAGLLPPAGGTGLGAPSIRPSQPRAIPTSRQSGTGIQIPSRLGGAISGSIIGGAFPLLFGQSGGAAAGGAIGGLVGGLAGPGGSFAGSLLGTLLGDIAGRGQAVKQLGEDLGFSAAQAKTLADAFKTANTDVEKFTAVIQNIRGVGLELEEQATAVQLVTALTEKYGGSFEKVGNAITSALESGKVSQAVLNQLTSQGITVQDALAAKYDVSRDKILEMAKKGEISVQSLLDTLVELGNASTTAAEKTQTPFEKALSTTGQLFQSFWKDVQTIFAGVSSNGVEAGTALLNIFNKLLQEVLFPLGRFLARIAALFIDVVSTGVRAALELINGFRGVSSAIGDALMGIVNMIPGLRTIVGLARQLLKGATGSKSSDWNDMPWPEGIPKPGSPGMVGQITAPSQAAPTGGAGAGSKPPEDRTAQLVDDLNVMRLISTTQDGIRDALFEGNLELAARLEYDQKIADITRDTSKALRNANYDSEKAAILAQQSVRVKDAELELEDKQREIVSQRFQDELRAQEAVRNAIKPFTELTQQQELQAQYSKTYLRLVTEGMLPAEAERQANFERLVTQQTTAVEEQLKLTEAAISEAKARGVSTVELEKQLNVLKQRQKGIQNAATQGPGQGPTKEERAAEAIAKLRGELNALTDPINVAVNAANAIGSAFQQAFEGIASGTLTAREALTSFFKSIGEAFVSMAAEIIAKQLVMITLQTILKALGLSGGSSGGGSIDLSNTRVTDVPVAQMPAGMAFAEGGFVTSPTRALIGEAGESEYVIPASKMSAAMSRYASGARGSSVIPASGDSMAAGGGGGGGSTFTLETVVINNVEYATVEQVRAMGQRAAAQGADGGHSRSMRTLQHSRSQRARLGMNR